MSVRGGGGVNSLRRLCFHSCLSVQGGVVSQHAIKGADPPPWASYWNAFLLTVLSRLYCFTLVHFIFRILRFFVVVIGVLLFAHQITDRTIVYYQRNTNVDVAVKYVPSVEFPSVTICNQNQFRYKFFSDFSICSFSIVYI